MGELVIRYDGTDITDLVEIQGCRFISKVNGQIGPATVVVKDLTRIRSYVTGRTLECEFDGELKWSGFVTNVRPGYYFSGGSGLVPRRLTLIGADRNVLLHKRFLYDKVTPTKTQLTTFPSGTADDVIIQAYLEDHLDLSGDGVGTSLIEHVGTPSVDSEISGAASWSWSEFMEFVRRNIGSIYYLDPDGEFVYTDVDTPSLDVTLTDRPVLPVTNPFGPDTFDRTLASGWGEGGMGAWTISGAGDWSVDGDEGVIENFGDPGFVDYVGYAELDGLTIDQSTYELTGEFTMERLVSSTNASLRFYLYETGAGPVEDEFYSFRCQFVAATPGALNAFLGSSGGSPGGATVAATPGEWSGTAYRFRWQLTATAMRLRVWEASGSEPGTWLLDQTHSVTATPTRLVVSPLSFSSPGNHVIRVASITPVSGVDGPGSPGAPSNDIGVRELEIGFSGEQLRNDALVWGIGQGSTSPVFSRRRDAASVLEHDLWQVGDFSQAMFRQATANRVADSYVLGSPQSKRGGKDDAVTVKCSVFDGRFRVAQKVTVRSEVFGFEDVLPIRQIEIIPVSKTRIRCDLLLSHEIDRPWATMEWLLPQFQMPNFQLPNFQLPVLSLPGFNPCAPFDPDGTGGDVYDEGDCTVWVGSTLVGGNGMWGGERHAQTGAGTFSGPSSSFSMGAAWEWDTGAEEDVETRQYQSISIPVGSRRVRVTGKIRGTPVTADPDTDSLICPVHWELYAGHWGNGEPPSWDPGQLVASGVISDANATAYDDGVDTFWEMDFDEEFSVDAAADSVEMYLVNVSPTGHTSASGSHACVARGGGDAIINPSSFVYLNSSDFQLCWSDAPATVGEAMGLFSSGPDLSLPLDVTVKVRGSFPTAEGSGFSPPRMWIEGYGEAFDAYFIADFTWGGTGGGAGIELYRVDFDTSADGFSDFPGIWVNDETPDFFIRVQLTDTDARMKYWKNGDPEPGSWAADFASDNTLEPLTVFDIFFDNGGVEGAYWAVDTVEINGGVDDFERSVGYGGGWGSGNIGAWVPADFDDEVGSEVVSGEGRLVYSSLDFGGDQILMNLGAGEGGDSVCFGPDPPDPEPSRGWACQYLEAMAPPPAQPTDRHYYRASLGSWAPGSEDVTLNGLHLRTVDYTSAYSQGYISIHEDDDPTDGPVWMCAFFEPILINVG